MTDPNQAFIQASIHRQQIADDLNAWNEDGEFQHPTNNVIAGNDDRLTDEICQQYAFDVFDAKFYVEDIDEAAAAEATAAWDALASMGFTRVTSKPS